MTATHPQTDDEGLEQLLAQSGGLPIIQVVLDLENDLTSIRCAGLNWAAVPGLLLRLASALTGEPPDRGRQGAG